MTISRFNEKIALASGDFSLRRCGSFACYRLWIYLCFWSTLVFDQAALEAASPVPSVFSLSTLCLALTLLAGGVFPQMARFVLDRPPLRPIPPILGGLGTLLCSLALHQQASPLLIFPCAALTGLGSGFLLLDMGREFCKSSMRSVALETALGYLVASVAFIFLPLLSLTINQVIAALALPLGTAALGFKRIPDPSRPPVPSLAANLKDKGGFKGPMMLKAIAGIICFGGSAEVMRGLFVPANPALLTQDYAAFSLGTIFTLTVPIIILCLFAKSFRLETLYRFALLFSIFGYLLVPLTGAHSFSFSFITASNAAFSLLVWSTLALLTSWRVASSSLRIIGLGWALVRCLSLLIGFTVVSIVVANINLSTQSLTIVSVALALVLVLTFLFVLTEKDFESWRVSFSPNANLDGNNNTSLEVRCNTIGHQYGLTTRECEVFYLLALGRNSQRISDELFIARGTTNTHMRNLYAKLGIHSQQELIDLVQDNLKKQQP